MKPISLVMLSAAIDIVGKKLDEDVGIWQPYVEAIRHPLISAAAMLSDPNNVADEVRLLKAYHYMMVAYVVAKRVPASTREGSGGFRNYTEELGLETLKAMFDGMRRRYADRD